ncbi:hypothetical protein BLNAU_360 [Blattamonas nauphoetae]|uniref:RING-type domain-containing protein n=1 Tax=Blattamonas nauphoetae TaxID=2049346 RepID=A0ABQ9YLL4_9EUKA|nr:hypothetical protein BLNAU_360 [Blattamonas nauphoetae]
MISENVLSVSTCLLLIPISYGLKQQHFLSFIYFFINSTFGSLYMYLSLAAFLVSLEFVVIRLFYGRMSDHENGLCLNAGIDAIFNFTFYLQMFGSRFSVHSIFPLLIVVFSTISSAMGKHRISFYSAQAHMSFFFHFRLITALFTTTLAVYLQFRYYLITFLSTSVSRSFALADLTQLLSIISIFNSYIVAFLEHHDMPKLRKPLAIIIKFYDTLSPLVPSLISLVYGISFQQINVVIFGILRFPMIFRRIEDGIKDLHRMIRYRLPSATQQDIERSGGVCVICREEMTAGKKGKCGHVFHADCIDQWMIRQPFCPICKRGLFDESGDEHEQIG